METESQIQSAICDYLELRPLFFFRTNNIPAFSKNGDGSIRMRKLPKHTPRGIPDIIVLKAGKFYALEVKRGTPKTYQTPEQKIFQENVEKHGCNYFVVRSINDVQKIGL